MDTDAHVGNRRQRSQGFSYVLLMVVTIFFTMIISSLVWGGLSDIEETAMVTWGGTLIGALGIAISYEWGSSKGSTLKDEVAAANAGSGSGPGGKPPSITVSTNPGGPPSDTTVKTETTMHSEGPTP